MAEVQSAKFFGAVKWQLVETGARQLVSLGVFALLSRILEPKDFGLLGMAMLCLSILSVVAEAGIGTALIQRGKLEPNHLQSAFVFSVTSSILIASITIGLSPYIAKVFDDPRLASIVSAIALILPINSFSTVQSTLMLREMDFRSIALRTISAVFVGGIAGIALALLGFSVWALVAQQLSTALVSSAATFSFSKWKPKFEFDFSGIRDLAPVGIAVLGNGLLWAITSRVDRYFVGSALGAEALGFYTIALRLPELLTAACITPLVRVSSVPLTRNQPDPVIRGENFQGSMLVLATLTVPVFAGLGILAPEIISVLFGEKWKYASEMASIISVNAIITNLTVLFSPIMLSENRTSVFSRFVFANAIGTVAINIFILPFGIHKMLLAQLAFNILLTSLTIAWLNQSNILKLRYFLSACEPAVTCGFLMAAILLLCQRAMGVQSPIVALAVQIPLGAVSYLALFYFLKPKAFQKILTSLSHLLPRSFRRNPLNADKPKTKFD